MPLPNDRAHDNRRRAESFGGLAQQYDHARPGYPAALIEDLVALHPTDVLDVGCGTGKAARLLADHGLPLLGVEVDPLMAEVARGHGLQVEVSAFETWDPAGRHFDLITCGQAWHWIDPVMGAAKTFSLLRPKGTLALFWNVGDVDAALGQAFDAVYAAVTPALARSVLRGGNRSVDPYRSPLEAAGFALRTRRYPWEQRYARAEYLELVGTHSDHSTLPRRVFDELTGRLGAAIDQHGGSVTMIYSTEVVLAAR
jgi:SAM-dependent methyltransferase